MRLAGQLPVGLAHPDQPSIARDFACLGIVVGFALLLNFVVMLLISGGS